MRRECRERFPRHRLQRKTLITLVSQIVEHTEIDEHLEKNAENLIVASTLVLCDFFPLR